MEAGEREDFFFGPLCSGCATLFSSLLDSVSVRCSDMRPVSSLLMTDRSDVQNQWIQQAPDSHTAISPLFSCSHAIQVQHVIAVAFS